MKWNERQCSGTGIFSCIFLMKSFVANRQFVPLLVFIDKIFDDSLKFFDHRSAGCQDEIFKLLGETDKT